MTFPFRLPSISITKFVFFKLLKLLTQKLTPRDTVLFEKLLIPQLVKKFHTFYAARKFIALFKKLYHFCPYPGPDESSPRPTSLRFIPILPPIYF
jgi:hypothetical protein